MTSALFSWKYIFRYNFSITYDREVVDPSFCRYKVALYRTWHLVPPNFAYVSTFLMTSSRQHLRTSNGQYLTKHNFLTTYRRKVVEPSLESPGVALYRKGCLVAPYCLISADVSTISAYFKLKIRKWRHMTSRDVTISKFHQNFRKCFFPSYLTCVQIWSHLHMFSKSYSDLLLFTHNFGIPKNIFLPMPHNPPITFDIGMQMT